MRRYEPAGAGGKGRTRPATGVARQVEVWHAALPCSGRIVSLTVRGRFATAVFRLGNRPTSKCDAPGALAAARFGIVRGKIVSWEQVPVDSARGPLA